VTGNLKLWPWLECAVWQHKIPAKVQDPGSFTIPCSISGGKKKWTTGSSTKPRGKSLAWSNDGVGEEFYSFLDDYSGYNRIAPEDLLKRTIRRMPFGLCNAPATFQRSMISLKNRITYRHNSLHKCFQDVKELSACERRGWKLTKRRLRLKSSSTKNKWTIIIEGIGFSPCEVAREWVWKGFVSRLSMNSWCNT
jgi:hypothetical protein